MDTCSEQKPNGHSVVVASGELFCPSAQHFLNLNANAHCKSGQPKRPKEPKLFAHYCVKAVTLNENSNDRFFSPTAGILQQKSKHVHSSRPFSKQGQSRNHEFACASPNKFFSREFRRRPSVIHFHLHANTRSFALLRHHGGSKTNFRNLPPSAFKALCPLSARRRAVCTQRGVSRVSRTFGRRVFGCLHKTFELCM